MFGENSPIKSFGSWLKASPWKPMVHEDSLDEVMNKSSGKQLFFAKSTTPRVAAEENQTDSIVNVTSLMGKVDLEAGVRTKQAELNVPVARLS